MPSWIEPRTRPAGPPSPQAEWRAAHITLTAMNFVDTPYVWGGSNPAQGFDCSGFTRHVFQTSAGVVLPRRSEEQAHATGFDDVDSDALTPGDLVFFNTLQRPFSHVGIHLGDQRFVHAPRTGAQVRVESLRAAYWLQRFNLARRLREPSP
jgi:cell wall-associated NlpC family hydrolase